jgi:hypothetical protein
MTEQKLVGIELVEKNVDVVGQDIIGKVAVKHQGKIGFLKLTLEGGIEFIPFANKAIDATVDFLEKKIPGDQTLAAEGLKLTLKSYLSKIKL